MTDLETVERLLAEAPSLEITDPVALARVAAILRAPRETSIPAPKAGPTKPTADELRRNARIPASLRAEILKQADYRCAFCGRAATQVDHMLPGTRGGTAAPENLAASCKPCNYEKSDFTVEEWAAWRTERGLTWPPDRTADVAAVVAEAMR